MSALERSVLLHFKDNHSCTQDERFVVPLPRKPHAGDLGEFRSQVVRGFLSLERALRTKVFDGFNAVMTPR